MSLADGSDGPACATGYFEVTVAQGAQIQVLPTTYADTCALMVNGVRIDLWALAVTDDDKELNYFTVQDRLQAATQAGRNPDRDFSLAGIFSDFIFVFSGRIPYTTYSTAEHHQGYMLAPLSSNLAVVGTWTAQDGQPSNPLRSAISLTIRHGGALSFWRILGLKELTLLAFLWF